MEQSTQTIRVASIDALRGFDMFWIIGGDALAVSLLSRVPADWAPKLADQFEHVSWDGFRFYDLIFPLFLFLVGCVLPYSLDKYRQQPAQAYWRIARRAAALCLLGLIGNGLLNFDWENLRIAGVLQRIGICYAVGALIFLHTGLRGQILAILAILIGYCLLLSFVPTPGMMAGDLSIEGNLVGWFDRNFLPGKIMKAYYGYGDNEGILSTIPAVATVLLGGLAGRWLQTQYGGWSKLVGMLSAGVVLIALGYLWSQWFPIIKNLWTSSFVLVAAGWSLVLLSLFYLLMDIAGWRRWAFGFTVIGMNAITIYFAQRFIDFRHMSEFFLSGFAALSGTWGTVLLIAGTLLAKFLFLWFLYSKRTFLRV